MRSQEPESNTNQQGSEDAEWLSSPSIGQVASDEDTANEPRKGDGTDATELLICQPGPTAKVHPVKNTGMRFTPIARQTIPA